MSDAMRECLVCGETTDKPIEATLWHFRSYESGNLKFLRGNIEAFGLWHGLRGTMCLIFPFINTLWNWKYRKCFLVIDGITDNQGRIEHSICLKDDRP